VLVLGGARPAGGEPPVAAAGRDSAIGAGGEAGDADDLADGGSAGEAGAGGAAGAADSELGREDAAPNQRTEADGQSSDFGGGAEVLFVSRFVWRGMALSRGPALEPSAWVSYAGVSASIWTNLLLQKDAERRTLSAVEPELSYELGWGRLKLESRLTLYWMRELPQASVTTEAGVSAMILLFGPLSLVNSHQLDVMETPGAYYGTLGLRVQHRLGLVRFGVVSNVGYATAPFNRTYFGVHEAAFDLLEGGLETRVLLEHSLYVGANAGLSALLSPALRSATSEPDLVYVGLSFGLER
jgi:hypothetical protein